MKRVLQKLWIYREWLCQRRQLLSMNERTLKDLGISRVDAERLAGCYGAENRGMTKEEDHDERDRLAAVRAGGVARRDHHRG